uniref:45 kDa calcium-binding protein n=2 Tax=Macrostomum lignano TaxID=282301 RepID=A0A1I8IKJ5_9PLAT
KFQNCLLSHANLCRGNPQPMPLTVLSQFLLLHLLLLPRKSCSPPVQAGSQSTLPQHLLPADHADAVRLESDTHINRDFVREVLFGEAHDSVRPSSGAEARKILTALFPRIDTNSDGRLSPTELAGRIAGSVAEHEAAARNSSQLVFAALIASVQRDQQQQPPRLSLRHYTVELMSALTGNRTVALAFADDVTSYRLSDDQARQLALNHHRWAQADADADGWLDADEFVCFQHSELCNATLENRLEDAFAALDRNADQIITRSEFMSPPESRIVEELPFGDGEAQQREADSSAQQQLRADEFDQRVDFNRDGRADREELRAYLQPEGRAMAAREAAVLMRAADANKDGALSLAEMLDHYSVFIGSKLVNAGMALHEEL